MVSNRVQNIPTVALLSVTGDGDAVADTHLGAQRQDVAGGSLIEYQIATLARAGVRHFLIEVDTINGSLVALADRSRGKKLTVDFVRSGADIEHYTQIGDRIWVQSAQVYIQLGLVETLLKTADNFIATVDARDENAAFERIDLNTRWAGVSVVGPETIAMLRDLPHGWSIISSLLRQALLAKVSARPLSQQHVNNGTLTVLSGAQDFSELNRQILRRRVASRAGFVEARLFGPILARVVPIIWQSPTAVMVTKCASPILAAIAVALGLTSFPTAAAVMAFLSIAANALRLAATDDADGGDKVHILSFATWALIIFAMFGAAFMSAPYYESGLFAAFAVAALTFLTRRMTLPDWAKQLLHSPATLALFAIIGSWGVGLTTALQWTMVMQLGILLVVSVRRDAESKKTKQA
jgi:hypothetical protein